MQARAMNSKAVVAAAMMMMVMTATAASTASAGMDLSALGRKVSVRTVMKYNDGAWTAPVAVVLKSPADWTAWNHDMVARGMAVAEEAVPAGVNWKNEAVLVVSLGMDMNARRSVDLESASRWALQTQVQLGVTYGQGGMSPCVVVAMDRSLASSVELVNGAAAGLPSTAQSYSAMPLASASAAGDAVAVTWGAMKDAYRR